ncbi:C1q-like domain-containing protein [Streptomyces anandii]|uniref:C1q-like domain-containing protein n=1 Tax=Streptomyces anandii TaxID=285454 RepID=UPI0037879A38
MPMAGLAVPIPASEAPGNFITGALWNANVYNGLTFLLNPPAFLGYQGSAQSTPNNTATPINLDSEQFDTYNGHSTSSNTSRYVAQVAGYYFVYGSVTWQTNASGIRVCQLAKNGTAVTGAYTATTTTSFNATANTACIVQLNANDYVEVWGNQNSGGALSTQTGATCSSMSCWFMHA